MNHGVGSSDHFNIRRKDKPFYLNHGVGSSDHFNIRRKDKPFYSYFQIFLVNLNLSRMPQVPP